MEAFLYCWTDNKLNMLYIGVHKGSKIDGYVCSSKLMLEEYKNRPNDFTRQIIAEGSYSDILNLENLLLKSVNAANNDIFYNQSNGNSKFYCRKHTKETRLKIEISNKNPDGTDKRARSGMENGMYGRKHNENTRKKMSMNAGHWLGKTHTKETKNKMKKKKPNYFTTPKGKFWWNNGKEQTQNALCPGDNWIKGRLSFKKRINN